MIAWANAVVAWVATPINLILIGLMVGWLAVWAGRRVLAYSSFAVSTLLLVVIALTPISEILLGELENRFPRAAFAADDIAGAIVLGGGTGPGSIARDQGRYGLGEGAERVTTAIEFHQTHRKWTIIFAGGRPPDPTHWPPERMVRDLIGRLGLTAERFIFDVQSTSTYTNGVETARIIDELVKADPSKSGPWLLVTSASHMPRAMAVFEAMDVDVLPYPVDFIARPPAFWRYRLQSVERFMFAHHVVKEWVGAISYWLLGRTNEIVARP